ncbi:unnamed protein product [Allacma fusca]|uniref:Serine carboxypeptidase n=1 Tax=Allacma fusca TaxID=39272 RepID=A0A8J2NML8_9HEXA|nr:unnamed protein product [Allacma fusca]
MRCVVVFGVVLLAAICQNVQAAPAAVDATKELILTPFIKSGDLDKARSTAQDNFDASKLKTSKPVKSFSGYLTVDEKTNSNLFFWFFPAQENPENAPVFLYVNERPGTSCLAAIFLDNGPFTINENNELTDRKSSWTQTNSMLYIDAPVGSGFSFADDDTGFAKTSDDEAQEVYDALIQFFTIFPEYQKNDFYMTGLAYAGAFIPSIGHKIDTENAAAALKINLKGFLIDSPFLDITKQADALGEQFYSLGLIDEAQKHEVDQIMKDFHEAVKNEDLLSALSIISSAYNKHDSHLAKFSGFNDLASALDSNRPPEFDRYQKFIDTKEVHNYLHVGLHSFVESNFKTFSFFIKDFLTPHIDHMQELLDKDYKVMGADDYAKAPRKIWKVMDDVAGYAKQSGKFSFVLMRNAGSHSFHDQPAWTYDLVQRFTQDKGFD